MHRVPPENQAVFNSQSRLGASRSSPSVGSRPAFTDATCARRERAQNTTPSVTRAMAVASFSHTEPARHVQPWGLSTQTWQRRGWFWQAALGGVSLQAKGVVWHTSAINDPKVVAAIDMAGSILKNDKYVNGGLGGVKTIATTSFTEAGLPILDGTCFLHRQASFYQANWPKGTDVSEAGDVWAFYLPGKTADVKPVLGGGEFAAIFADRPEVHAFQAFLASPEWSNEKAKATPNGGWLSANKKLDPANLTKPMDKLSYTLLTDAKTVFRFDGSDLMPSAVGAGSFWKEMTNWIALDKSSQDVANDIEKTWPKS